MAGRLADAGVPAVVAMQGLVSMATVRGMVPTFFSELWRDGRIDRALAVVRGKVRDRPDAWMPALFTRLVGGRLWYEAGFADRISDEVWRRLVTPVRNGKVVPIIGPRLLEGIHGGVHDIALRLAGQHRFPLQAQLDPDMQEMTDVEGAKRYLAEYFGQEANIDIYWGSSTEFLRALHEQLREAIEQRGEGPDSDPRRGRGRGRGRGGRVGVLITRLFGGEYSRVCMFLVVSNRVERSG